MKICWFDDNKLGLVHDGLVFDVSAALEHLPPQPYPGPPGDPLIANLETMWKHIEAAAHDAPAKPVGEARFLSPVARPTKVIGTPANYTKHVEEAEADPGIVTSRFRGKVEEQGLFLKAVSALVGPGQGVRLRFADRRTDHEMELGVVIGRTASNIEESEALAYVAGYSIALDMSVRGPEDRSLRKSVDSYAVLGPWLVTADEIEDPDELDFSLWVNDEQRQSSNTRNMIVDVKRQIAWASSFYTLHPGDIIMTGTCEGVGPVVPGDVMTCDIQGIGEMQVRVEAGDGYDR
jgi:2,4-diketo-3-deoxy-L-fuconate hydrolase